VIEKGDGPMIVELDTRFHELICKASRSKRIEEISQTLRDHMLRFRMEALCEPEVARRSNEGHRRILRAIGERDEIEIGAAVRYHLKWTKMDVSAVIERKADGVEMRRETG